MPVLRGFSQNCEKRLRASSCLYVCLSVRMKQFGSQWTNFEEIWYLNIFRKSVEKIQDLLRGGAVGWDTALQTRRSLVWFPMFFFNATTCSYEFSWSPLPGCGGSVTDFWGWDAHEAQLRCPDGMRGDILGNEVPGGALSLDLLTTQTTGIFPLQGKFPW